MSMTQSNTYTIKKGDTLYQLAKKYNTTVGELKQLNNLTTDILTIGSTIKLPVLQQSPNKNDIYIIQPGDTLYKIATQNNTTVEKLKQLNNLTTNTLTIGNALQLPPTEIIKIPAEIKEYTIKKGDTLYKIAKDNNTTVEKLKEINNLTTNNLSIGQIIEIPTTKILETPTTRITYTVEPGDTLFKIAKEYNTTVNNLKELNNLTTNLLTVGQILIINP